MADSMMTDTVSEVSAAVIEETPARKFARLYNAWKATEGEAADLERKLAAVKANRKALVLELCPVVEAANERAGRPKAEHRKFYVGGVQHTIKIGLGRGGQGATITTPTSGGVEFSDE